MYSSRTIHSYQLKALIPTLCLPQLAGVVARQLRLDGRHDLELRAATRPQGAEDRETLLKATARQTS